MIVKGLDHSLPPPDDEKGHKKQPSAGKKFIPDQIELSPEAQKRLSKSNGLSEIKSSGSDTTRPEIPGHKVSSGDRIEINSLKDRSEKLALVRQKIADGYYNSPQYIEKLVDILIENLKLDRTEKP